MAIDKKELLKKVNPVEYMEKHLGIEVIKKGSSMTALSPFAPDRNPSLSIKQVDNDRWIMTDWRLPPDERSKNIIDVTMAVTELPFYEAMKKINEDMELNLDIKSPEAQAYHKEVKRTMEINQEAFNYYQQKMQECDDGQDYMKKRGYSLDECQKYGIGFMPKFDKGFIQHMEEKGFKAEEIVKSRLVNERDNGELSPNFGGRVMFAYKNKNGNIVGFSGRSIEPDTKAKYLNTPTIKGVFEKGNIMFNEDRASQDRKNRSIIVTEGFMDALAYQKMIDSLGIEKRNAAVAVGTASITDEQAKKLSLYRNVFLSLDNDEAGKRGTLDSVKKLVNTGAEVFVNVNSDTKDFDEFYHNNIDKMSSIESVRDYFANSLTASEYIAKEISSREDRKGFQDFCNFIKDIDVEYRHDFLKDFNLERKMNNWETAMLAASLQISSDYLPFILDPKHVPKEFDVELQEKEEDRTFKEAGTDAVYDFSGKQNFSYELSNGVKFRASFEDGKISENRGLVFSKPNVDTTRVLSVMERNLPQEADISLISGGKFDYIVHKDSLTAIDRTNNSNIATFSTDKFANAFEMMKSANGNLFEIAETLKKLDVNVGKVEIDSPDFRGNVKQLSNIISEKLGYDVTVEVNGITSGNTDSKDENFDIT